MKSYKTNLMLLSAVAPFAAMAAEQERPNVIIVITDDQGKGDLGCLGNDVIKTPNLDRFYENSVRLSNFHVSPTSGPTRSAIMTGRFTDRTGCYHTVGGRDKVFEDERLMPQYFAEAGYKTGMFGKWHLGDNYPYRPEDRGFQEVVRLGGGGVGQGPDYWYNDYFDDTYWHNSVPQKYEGYCTDVFFGEAMRFIEENKKQPFFCYLALNAPHGPFNVPEEYYNLYKGIKYSDQIQRFYGMITNIDDNFKRLEDKLKKLGIADNTILIFMTDNGSVGTAANKGGMRGHKGDPYEGGHCVPFFIQWKDGGITGGRDIDKLTAHVDMIPTLAKLCGIKVRSPKPLDGRDLTPLIYNPDAKWSSRALVTDSQRNQNLVKWRGCATMIDDWRLINGTELYNLKNDKMQENDIAAENPEVVARLREAYNAWWSDLDAENIADTYQYIWVGTPYENPTRISAHELHTQALGLAWNQIGALKPEPCKGVFKIKFATSGEYKISLCRYPLESGLKINEKVPAQEERVEIQRRMPASSDVKMAQTHLYFADLADKIKGTVKDVSDDDYAVSYTLHVEAGKYDVEAYFTDEVGRFFNANYIYFEKLD